MGYGNLVDAWLGISLDKGARFTDGRAARWTSGRSIMQSATSRIW